MSVREVEFLDPYKFEPYPKQEAYIEGVIDPFFVQYDNKNHDAAQKVRDILRDSRRHRPSHNIYRHHLPRDWEGKPVPPPKSKFAKSWTCETSVINTEVAGIKVTLYVHCSGLMQPSLVVEVAKGPDYMKGWCSQPYNADNMEQFNKSIEICKNKLRAEVIDYHRLASQKPKEAPPPKLEEKIPQEKANFPDPKNELKKLLDEMKDFDFVYQAFIESWKKRKDPNYVHDPKQFKDPRIQKLSQQLSKLEQVLEALATSDEFDPAELAEYLAAALRESLDGFRIKKKQEPIPWYEKAISMLKEKLKRVEEFQKRVQATTRKPFKPLLDKIDAFDKKMKDPFRVKIKDVRRDLKYFRATGEYDKSQGRERIDRSSELLKTAEKIERRINTQKGDKVQVTLNGETRNVSKKTAAKIAERFRDQSRTAYVKGTLQTAKGFAKTSAANISREALKNAKQQMNGIGSAASGSLGSALAYAITDKNLRADPEKFTKTVVKETGKSMAWESVKSFGHATGVEAIKQVSKDIGEGVPGVFVCSLVWETGKNIYKSKTFKGCAFKTGLMTMNTAVSMGCTFAGSLIPIPGVGTFAGAFAGGLANQGLNWAVMKGANALNLLPAELAAT